MQTVTGIAPLKFHSSAKKCENIDNVLVMKWRHRIHATFTILAIIQWLLKQNKSPIEEILSTLFVSMHLDASVLVHEVGNKAPEIVQLFNALFHCDKAFPGAKGTTRIQFKDIIKQLTLYAMVVTSVAVPLGIVPSLHWLTPCKASLVGYVLIPKCDGWLKSISDNPTILIIKQIIICINIDMWAMTTASAVFSVGVLNLMCASSIQQCTQRFDKL